MKVINISVLTDKIIRLGRRGEGNVRQIVFDCTCFEETYGSGTAQLLHWRRGDEAPYPVLIEQNDNIVTWTVQESDTANVGIGEAEIIWMLPDGNAKSAVYETETLRSLSEPGDPPEPWQAWVDEVLKAAEAGGATPEQIAGTVEKYLAEHPIEETDPTVPEWAKQPEKPSYTASEVGADATGTAESKVSDHNTRTDTHNDIRILIESLTARLNALADSDDNTLDQMSEVVAYIKSNKSLIDAITTSKVNVSDIIDNLTTNVSNKPLSAAQGVKLKALIDAITAVELDETLTDNTKAAPAGMVGELKSDLTNINKDLDDLTYEGTKHYKSKSEQGYISSSGDLNVDTDSNYRRTSDYIDMSNVNSVVFSMPNGTTGIYAEYDENKTFIQRVNISDGTLITTSKFIKFAFYNVNGMTEELFDTCYSIQGKVYFNEKIKSLEEKCTRINNTELKEVVDGIYLVTPGSINATFLRYNISKGDKFKIKVNNCEIDTELTIGTHTIESASGFTETLFTVRNSTSTKYDVIVEANIDALFFKIYAEAEGVKITIEKQTDKSVNDAGYYSPFYSYKIKEKNVAEYFKCPFNNGDEIEIELNNPTVSSETVIGIVSEEGASGFERVIFNSKNLPAGNFKIKHNVQSDYGYIKVFSAENVGLNFSKKIYESDLLSSNIGDAIVDSAEISTYGSYYEHQIHVGDFYQIHLSNIPIGCDVKVGTNSVGGSGFTDTFISIQNASETEYHTTCNAKIDESAFKYWASIAGVKVTINSFLVKKAVDVTGGSTGYVVCGENVTGGKNDYCVAIGSNTLHSNTGVKNIAIGNDNMGDCTGNDNTSEGYHALFRNTSGSYNSAIGSEAQDDNTTGNFNSALGFCSLQRNNTGSYNVAVGAFALQCIYGNRYDPNNLKSISNNVAVGANALFNAESGSENNVAIGYNTLRTQKQYRNCVAIGEGADCTKNNQMVLGSSAITEVVLMGNKKLIFNSDGTVTWEEI